MSKKKLGLMIIGSLKNFENSKKYLKKLLNYYKNSYDICIFCYISKETYYQNWYKKKIKKKYKIDLSIEKHNKNDILLNNMLKNSGFDYKIEYYKSSENIKLDDELSKFCKIKEISKDNTIVYQIFLEYFCCKQILEYEKINGKFDYIVKTRPDNKFYNNMNFINLIDKYEFIYKRDVFYMTTRDYFNSILQKINVLDLTKQKYYEIFQKIIDKKPPNQKTNEYITHHLNELILLYLDKFSIYENMRFTNIYYKLNWK